MNFNHLMDPRKLRMTCRSANSECYWIPVGSGRSMGGDNVHVSMMCKRCQKREDIFLSKREYKTQEKIIEKEVTSV
jgi:hypothetical protein|tara:strand:+ start:24 stop:251 length:228 start_codon:yes stop_codon:yes gene_type:complete